MTNLEEAAKKKVQLLLQWLRSNQASPKRSLRECARLVYDVDVFHSLANMLSEIPSPDDIHTICKQLAESYITEEKQIKLLVILLIPPMLQSYLVQHHSNSKQFNSSSPTPIFNVGKLASGLDALSSILLHLYQLAPKFLRTTEYLSPDSFLPASSVNSIYHSASEFQRLPIEHTSSGIFNSFKVEQQQKMAAASDKSVVDASCLLRIYTNSLIHQLTERTSEQRSVVLASIRTFCLFVNRIVSLNARPRIPSSPNFLINLISSIDCILFVLNFEHDFLLTNNHKNRVFIQSEATEKLRNNVFDLLGSVERLASYHCFYQVILLVSAVHSTWSVRFKHTFVRTHLTSSERRTRSVSMECVPSSGESSKSSGDEEPSNFYSGRPSVGPSHAPAITNASFRPEAVAEDIPISQQPHGHLHHRQYDLLHLSEKQQFTRSSENIASMGGFTDPDAKNVRRIKHLGKFWLHKI